MPEKDTQKYRQRLWKIFLSTLYLSAFTFGGGYVIVTLMKKKFVDEYHWIEEDEMLDLVAIAQSSPGAIAVNAAILVGWRVAGFAGKKGVIRAGADADIMVLGGDYRVDRLFARGKLFVDGGAAVVKDYFEN